MNEILRGALAMGFAVAGIFFLRFWRRTRDPLFALFALAFLIMSANRIGLAIAVSRGTRGGSFYWMRLLAFLLILAAILDKNRSRKPAG